MGRLHNKSGVTIIETLISMLLLAIVMVGGMAMYFHSDEMMRMAVHKKIAVEMIQTQMESVRSQSFDAIVSSSEPGTDTVGLMTARTTKTVTGFDSSDPADGIIDYKRVDLTLSWTEAGRTVPELVSLTTYVAR